MKVLKTSPALRQEIARLKRQHKTIGFVPTMGFLHGGHLSLVRRAQKDHDVVVVSIFVNPLQFGPKEDYRRYPRKLKLDAALLRRAGTDVLYAPEALHCYPDDFQTGVSVRNLSRPLCGVSRPTHFSGVATVVLKLLNLLRPDTLYLGQKDYQQFRVIQQMVKDLDLNVSVRMVPVVRELDGLAMSSRNVLLTPQERRDACFLFRGLEQAKQAIQSGERSVTAIKRALRHRLAMARSGRVEYAEIVNAKTLASVVRLAPGDRVLVTVAVVFPKARLIDNCLVKVKK